MSWCEINDGRELILVTAGGKANIKIWRVIFSFSSSEVEVEKIVNLYEFKRLRARKSATKGDRPWLYIDLKSNPDIRFMDVRMFESTPGEFMLVFACSDGHLRIFRYLIESNKLDLLAKHPYPKCLLCLDMIKLGEEKPLFVGFATDGSFLSWKLDIDGEEIPPSQIYENLHQSGVNSFDLWRDSAEARDLVMVSVGDDTRINILEIQVDSSEGLKVSSDPFGIDMAHASSITGF